MNKRNFVQTNVTKKGMLEIIDDHRQVVTVDANFFIPPDRSKELKQGFRRAVDYELFRDNWMKPLLMTFPSLAIHEAVYKELRNGPSLNFVTDQIQKQYLILLEDDTLSVQEDAIRALVVEQIAPHTKYHPHLDNRADRGEVKSLAHIAAKQYLHFCSHDANALRLIDDAEALDTMLDSLMAIRTYEMIYYLFRMEISNKGFMRSLYKYLYHFTTSDKCCNPSWEDFLDEMDHLYLAHIEATENRPLRNRNFIV